MLEVLNMVFSSPKANGEKDLGIVALLVFAATDTEYPIALYIGTSYFLC